MKKTPLLTNEYIGNSGVKYIFEYFETDKYDDVPIDEIKQAYAVAWNGNNFIVVNNTKHPKSYGLVGGSVEAGEKPEETLIREIQEESNMKVLEYKLIGYQKVTDTRGIQQPFYQFRYFAIVEPYGPFVADPAGFVTEVIECNQSNYKKYFDWGAIGDRIIEKAIQYKKEYDDRK